MTVLISKSEFKFIKKIHILNMYYITRECRAGNQGKPVLVNQVR